MATSGRRRLTQFLRSPAGIAVLVLLLAGVVLYRTGASSSPSVDERPAGLIDRPWLTLDPPDKLQDGHVAVIRVIDGDTLKVRRRGKDLSVRLIGIDTPEVGRHRVNPGSDGWRATMFVYGLLEDNPQVRLEFDREREDKYGRTLAYVYLPDGRMLNRLLLEEGRAETMRIPPNTRHADEFAAITR